MITLDEAQENAVARLRTGSILCGGVGSGKSAVAITYYWCKKTSHKPVVIITTAKKRDDHEWEDEFAKLEVPANNVTVDSWNNIAKYENVRDRFFIFDENHLSGKGKWATTFIKIAKHNQWILLTATPGDTWLDYATVFIANGFYKNRTDFNDKHVIWNPFVSYPSVKQYINCDLLAQLRNNILVNLDVQSRPLKHEQIIQTQYSKSDYDYALARRWDIFKNEPCRNASAMCYVLRRIVNDNSNRIDLFEYIIRNATLKKFIVFYTFNYELERLRASGKRCGYDVAEWNGHKHMYIPSSENWLYLVQYNSGAEGWNCTKTNQMIFYSPTYSFKTLVQAMGRIDRRSTPFKDLYYYHILTDSSIEKAIQSCLEKKRKFNEGRFLGWENM